jgi:hypothetical protein
MSETAGHCLNPDCKAALPAGALFCPRCGSSGKQAVPPVEVKVVPGKKLYLRFGPKALMIGFEDLQPEGVAKLSLKAEGSGEKHVPSLRVGDRCDYAYDDGAHYRTLRVTLTGAGRTGPAASFLVARDSSWVWGVAFGIAVGLLIVVGLVALLWAVMS